MAATQSSSPFPPGKPPSDVSSTYLAETLVLGYGMTHSDVLLDVCVFLNAFPLLHPKNRVLLDAIKHAAKLGEVCPATVSACLPGHAASFVAEEVGAITDRAKSLSRGAFLAYVSTLRRVACNARLVGTCTRLVTQARAHPADDLMMGACDALASIDSAMRWPLDTEPKHLSMRDTMRDLLAELSTRQQSGSDMLGLSTGFQSLDGLLSGLCPGDLTAVAARLSVGKSALALNIAEHPAVRERKCVLFLSLEMSRLQLAYRLVAASARVNVKALQAAQLTEGEWTGVCNAIARLSEAPIYIAESSVYTPTQPARFSAKIATEHGLDLIVVDYLQLLQAKSRRDGRTVEVSDVSRALKRIAMDQPVPVLELSQLNRSVEQRPDKRPMLSDLRDSGAIEQDADNVVFIYRDDYYHRDSRDPGLAELIVAKQRMGPTGTTRLALRGDFARFDDLAHASPPD